MPSRPYLYARQRVRATTAEIQAEFIRAQQALVDQLDARPDVNNCDQMRAWFIEVTPCWDYYFRLFRELESRWRKAAAPSISSEEAEATWRYWQKIEREGEIIR